MNAENAKEAELRNQQLDEELLGVLTAISVITRSLAKKISENLRQKEETEDVQTLRSGRTDSQG